MTRSIVFTALCPRLPQELLGNRIEKRQAAKEMARFHQMIGDAPLPEETYQ